MKVNRLAFCAGLCAVVACAFAQAAPDPEKLMEQLHSKQYATREEFTSAAAGLIKDVDPAKIDPKAGVAWARLFEAAQNNRGAITLLTAYLATKPNGAALFEAQSMLAGDYAELADGAKVAALLPELKPTTVADASMLSEMVLYEFMPLLAPDVDKALSILDAVSANVAEVPGLAAAGAQGETTIETLAASKAAVLAQGGRKAEALAVLDKAIAGMKDPAALKSAQADRKRLALVGDPAPELGALLNKYGEFVDLASLKGKVVVVDFFAHWCPPCRAELPELAKLYAGLKDKGVQVVGVTAFYGYYKQEHGISVATEYARMAEFMKLFGMTWPVAFLERNGAAYTGYGVTGIPETIVIDRKGIVRKVEVGYEPSSFAALRKLVESVANES